MNNQYDNAFWSVQGHSISWIIRLGAYWFRGSHEMVSRTMIFILLFTSVVCKFQQCQCSYPECKKSWSLTSVWRCLPMQQDIKGEGLLWSPCLSVTLCWWLYCAISFSSFTDPTPNLLMEILAPCFGRSTSSLSRSALLFYLPHGYWKHCDISLYFSIHQLQYAFIELIFTTWKMAQWKLDSLLLTLSQQWWTFPKVCEQTC